MNVNCIQRTDGPQLTSCEYPFEVDAIKKLDWLEHCIEVMLSSPETHSQNKTNHRGMYLYYRNKGLFK
jgi:hypothetical protein